MAPGWCPCGSEHGCPLPNTRALCITGPSPSRIPVVHPSPALPGDGSGAEVTSEGRTPTPRVPLLPSPPPSHPLLFLNRGAGCSVQPRTNRPSPRSRSGRQPRPVLPTHTTLAPSGFRSGLARGLPTSQGISCPGMQLIWLSPPYECWGRLLHGASPEPRAPFPLPQPSQVDRISGRDGGGRANRRRKRH